MNDIKLTMTFKNTLGKSFSITIDDPREDLSEEEIMTTMNLIKDKNIFAPGGYDISECVAAKIVNSSTTQYDLVL